MHGSSTVSVPVLYATLSLEADAAEAVIDMVTQERSAKLDSLVGAVEAYLDETRDGGWSDTELQRMVVRIPTTLYRFSDSIARASIESDIAKATLEKLHAEYVLGHEGRSIADRKAMADLATARESTLTDLTKIVLQKLRMKADYAMALYEAVKKIMTQSDKEKETFRQEVKR